MMERTETGKAMKPAVHTAHIYFFKIYVQPARKRKLQQIINRRFLIAFESRMVENPTDPGYTIFGGEKMKRFFTMEYWRDDDWFVGRLKEVPGVFSQGESLEELKENIADAYRLMLEAEQGPEHADAQTLEVGVDF